MGDDTGSQNFVGLGLGIYRTEYKRFDEISTAQSTSSTTGVTNLGGKAMIGRMDSKGHFVEAAYTYTGSSLSNGLSATFGLRF